MTKVFISHSIKDGKFTIKIMKLLAALANIFIYANEDNGIVILNEEDQKETLAYKNKEFEGYL